eukprot:m.232289 g.232289  ORF g.232289 m.232289 type:complete len:788 (+) comp19273_c0_seq2:129-2492(+)
MDLQSNRRKRSLTSIFTIVFVVAGGFVCSVRSTGNETCESGCQPGNLTFELPLGNYWKSCRNCSIDYHMLICNCARSDVGAPETIPYGLNNLTGEWMLQEKASGMHENTIVITANASANISQTSSKSLYVATCVDGGHDGVCSPRPVDPVVWGVQQWYRGALHLSAIDVSNVTLRLDNGSMYIGTLAADNNSIAFRFVNTTNSSGPGPAPPVPPGHNMTWQRRAPNATGTRTTINMNSCAKVPGWASNKTHRNVTNEDGFLTCDWTRHPPPRVGPYAFSVQSSGNKAIQKNCRIIAGYTFLAPQFKARGDPVGSLDVSQYEAGEQKKQCCTACHESFRTGGPLCRGWTILNSNRPNATCYLTAGTDTAYPTRDDQRTISGYVLHADPGTLCMAKFESQSGFWADRNMAEQIDCRQLPPPSNASDAYPRWWTDGKHARGTSWLFFPINATTTPQCECVVPAPQRTVCHGPNVSTGDIAEQIRGKPWIVFVHGGDFEYYDAIDANYAETTSRVAAAAGMGVYAMDYRSLASKPKPATFPDPVKDVIAGLQWLHSNGAGPLYIYGDSSGGTMAIEALLYMIREREVAAAAGQKDPYDGIHVQGGGAFSPWLDLSCSYPQYDTRRQCKGGCHDIGSMSFPASPGPNRVGSMCTARRYANYEEKVSVDDAIISPIDAPQRLLAKLPPLMLIVGGAEVLLGENIAFAQKVQRSGASAVVEVFTDMWHDFMQETEGCGSRELSEATTAIARLGNFFRNNESCKVVCTGGVCHGAAPVQYHFNYHEIPPVRAADC